MPFTLVILPDTQNYPKAYHDILTRQAEWIAANAESLNIGAVLNVGDIVDNNEPGQWERAARSLHVLDGVVPYVLAVGNHDVRISYTQERSLFNRDGSLINNYFTVEDARRYSGLGGTFAPGRLENSYSVFSLGGTPYIVFALEWGPRDEVLAWADVVLSAHPDHKAILITDAFTAPDGGWVTPDRFLVSLPAPGDFVPEPSTVNSAAEIWERLIHRHSNVFLQFPDGSGRPVSRIPSIHSRKNGGHGAKPVATVSHAAPHVLQPLLFPLSERPLTLPGVRQLDHV